MSEENKVAGDTAIEVTKDLSIQMLITDGKNPRGIPAAKFIVSHFFMASFPLLPLKSIFLIE
jgi:hypothetical protein